VSIDEQHIALPKLYGAPAYARPPAPITPTDRPLDPDDLPIAAFQTDEERALAEAAPARAYTVISRRADDRGDGDGNGSAGPRARDFSIRAIAGRIVGGD
jgi:hypothetical protein